MITTNNKQNKFFHRLQHLPLACSGLALGLSGYASLIDVMFQKYLNIESTTMWIASCFFIPIALILITLLTFKYCKHNKIIKFEINDPLFSSFIPTYTMVLMSIGGFIAGWEKGGDNWIAANQVIAAFIMCAAILIQLIIFILFVKKILMKHSWHQKPMYGSWFVPSVGIATACTFANRFNQNILPDEFFQAVWFFAFITYVFLLIPITYSMLFKTKVPNEKLASTAVYFAPANLTLSGFLQTFSLNSRAWEIYQSSHGFIVGTSIFLWAMGITMMIILLIFTFKILFTTNFNFLFASLTFPLAIGAIGSEYMNLFLNKPELGNSDFVHMFANLVGLISTILIAIVTIIILYIASRFIFKIGKILFTKNHDDEHHSVYQNSESKPTIIQS